MKVVTVTVVDTDGDILRRTGTFVFEGADAADVESYASWRARTERRGARPVRSAADEVVGR